MASVDGEKQTASDSFMITKIDVSRLALCLGFAIAVVGVALIVHGMGMPGKAPQATLLG